MKLNEIYEGKHFIYSLSELYSGGELMDQIVMSETLTEHQCLGITHSILKALCYLESKKIVHRDLKPQNIVLRNEGNIYDLVLVDFGFAVRYSDISVDNDDIPYCVGTPGYVAPEMMRAEPYDTKADVFSLGCMLYMMLTYWPPFFSKNKAEVIKLNRICDPDWAWNNWKNPEKYKYSDRTID